MAFPPPPGSHPAPIPPPGAAPWYVALAAAVLNERGLATLLTLILVAALLWAGYQFMEAQRAFESAMIAQHTAGNERLTQMNDTLERIERLMLGAYSAPPGVRP